MKTLIAACILLSAALAAAGREVTYGFATSDYFIEMRVRFLRPYSGRRLVFFSSIRPAQEVCYSGDERAVNDCARRFVGAVAIVTYAVKSASGEPAHGPVIREHVTVLGRSCGLSDRAPFSKMQALVKGSATDLQVFGYDEAAVVQPDRGRMRAHMRAQWTVFRQRLYMAADEKPFAIVEWKHTLARIEIVKIYAPPDPYREPPAPRPELIAACRTGTW